MSEITQQQISTAMRAEEIGKRFKHFREAFELTPEQAAKKVGIFVEQIALLEQGQYKVISAQQIFQLAASYGIPVADFFNAYALETDLRRILGLYRESVITEGYAAHLLSTDRPSIRLLADPTRTFVVADRSKVTSLHTDEAAKRMQPSPIDELHSLGRHLVREFDTGTSALEVANRINVLAGEECASVLEARNRRKIVRSYACRECGHGHTLFHLRNALHPGCDHSWEHYIPVSEVIYQNRVWRLAIDLTRFAAGQIEQVTTLLSGKLAAPLVIGVKTVYARYWDKEEADENNVLLTAIVSVPPSTMVGAVEQVDA